MSKTAASYSLSRHNATKFGIQHEGPIPCLGPKRCRHLHCGAAYTPPSDGSPCPWEAEYARRLEAEFRERHEMLTIMPDVEDFEGLVRQHVNILLQRSRAMTRLNRGWDKRADNGSLSQDAYREFSLAELYLDRLSGREERLQATLDEGLERMRARAERLRPHLQMMELFVAGKQAASDAAKKPPEPVWDEFADAPTTDPSSWSSSA